jgi:tetratricopeptide (TPR) repeat protein
LWTLAAVFLVALTVGGGALAGYQSGSQARRATQADQGTRSLQEQYDLGSQDLAEGRYDLARQRFEYILAQDPGFPAAADGLAQAMAILYATATPTPVLPTPTTAPTPTPDLRPVQDLFAQAQVRLASSDWSGAIDTLINLRKADPAFQAARVDGMLYLALRIRGVDKILSQSDLEGGTYDLALAERFGPLDGEAEKVRSWARLYIYGSSFWEAYPEQAVYYFSQAAAVAPFLRDASGWTARDRYWASLIQLGDQLARSNDWCKAQAQYELALSIQANESLQAKTADAVQGCTPPTPIPSSTAILTPTPTITETPIPEVSPSPTSTFVPPTAQETSTPTSTLPASTSTSTSPAPTDVSTPTPTPPAPTTVVPPSDTPIPPTDTATPTPSSAAPVTPNSPLHADYLQVSNKLGFFANSAILALIYAFSYG